LVVLIKEHYDLDMEVKNLQGCCLAHVVNLVVQKLLKSMGEILDDPDDVDYFLLDNSSPIHYTPEEHPELMNTALDYLQEGYFFPS
jgi:hypothetical protein